jgi:Skp family chaperone for outer membrane proteins
MKTNFLKLFAVFTVLFSVAVLADLTFAQPRRARGKTYTKAEVGQVIKRVETRVDSFVKQYDRSLDNSSLNGSNKEDWLNKRAKDLEKATDELRREFDKRDAWIENKDEVRKCMNIATDIDKNMKNKRYGNATEDNWRAVVFELNTLAKLYNVPQVGSRAY